MPTSQLAKQETANETPASTARGDPINISKNSINGDKTARKNAVNNPTSNNVNMKKVYYVCGCAMYTAAVEPRISWLANTAV